MARCAGQFRGFFLLYVRHLVCMASVATLDRRLDEEGCIKRTMADNTLHPHRSVLAALPGFLLFRVTVGHSCSSDTSICFLGAASASSGILTRRRIKSTSIFFGEFISHLMLGWGVLKSGRPLLLLLCSSLLCCHGIVQHLDAFLRQVDGARQGFPRRVRVMETV